MKFKYLALLTTAFAVFLIGCPKGQPGPVSDETAATVNGTPIKMEEVERAVKAQAQGQEATLSPMELASARLQVLQQIIQQEVMYQKAQQEQTVPKDEEVKSELNKRMQSSGLSKEAFQERLKATGQTEETLMESLKKELATSKLVEKVTGKVETPTEAEIKGFYDGNKEFFVKKRGVELASIVVDPRNDGNDDKTKNEAEASQRIKEIGQQLDQGADFATVAREKSEDPSAIRGGDLGNISEEELKSTFSEQIAAGFMNEQFKVGSVAGPFQIQGRYFFFKLKNRIEKDEELNLESPGVKQQVTDTLVNNRKQLLAASYQAVAMNEAKIVNFLAQRVIDNPNELSGARPVDPNKKAETPAANANAAPEGNAATSENTNAAADEKPAANTANSAEPKASPAADEKTEKSN